MKPPVHENCKRWAGEYLLKQLKQLSGQREGIRLGVDPECVHRARVATRRLRAALPLFEDYFEHRAVKRWKKEIRRLGKDLGAARDADVQVEFVTQFLARSADSSCTVGVARLLARLDQQRESLQADVLKALDRFLAAKVNREMRSAIKKLLAKLPEPADGPSEFAFPQAEKQILEHLEDLLSYESSLEDPRDDQEHHAMRIAAKRLRYTIEIARPAFGGRLNVFLGAIKEIQRLLGEIHDCDVWFGRLDAALADERRHVAKAFGHEGPLARLQAGLDYFRSDRRTHQQATFVELVAYWRGVCEQELWEHLACTVRREAPAEREQHHGDASNGNRPSQGGNGRRSHARPEGIEGPAAGPASPADQTG